MVHVNEKGDRHRDVKIIDPTAHNDDVAEITQNITNPNERNRNQQQPNQEQKLNAKVGRSRTKRLQNSETVKKSAA